MVDSQRVEQALSLTRAHFRAPPAARARVRAALQARGEFGPVQHGTGASRAVGIAKSTAALLAGMSFIAGFWLGGQRGSDAAPPAPVAAVAARPAPPAPAAPAEPGAGTVASAAGVPAPAARAAESQRPARPGVKAAPRPAGSGANVSEELAVLQRAERALRSGQPELALSFLDELDRRYPTTPLAEERSAARLMARCARGELDASAHAELFLREHQSSVYSDRLRELCRIDRAPAAADGSRAPGHYPSKGDHAHVLRP